MSQINIVGVLNLRAPNVGAVTRQISQGLRNATATVSVRVNAGNLAQAQQSIRQTQQAIRQLGSDTERFGELVGLAARRFSAFNIGAGAVARASAEMREALSEAIAFEQGMVRIEQVSRESQTQIATLGDEISRLSTTYGVSSKQLLQSALTLKQTGISINEVRQSLEAIGKASLAPNFDNMVSVTETAIATFRQFGKDSSQLEKTLGSINQVAADFAVEAKDLESAIKKAGGSFAAAGGDLSELLALFTSVRATTRESADEIGTGLRTIFARLQRSDTIDALKALQIELRNTEGQFVGPYEAVRRLSEGLGKLQSTDPRFSAAIEQLGGYRQISRVIPLIQQFSTAQQALNSARAGEVSLAAAAEKAQGSLANRLDKLKESYLEVGRSVLGQSWVRMLADGSITAASSIGTLVKALSPLLPILAGLAAGAGVRALFNFAAAGTGAVAGIARGVVGGRTASRFARGGIVPGEGNTDSHPAYLMPGEFVIRKQSAKQIGYDNLQALNEGRVKMASGGQVQRLAGGGQTRNLVIPNERIDSFVYATTGQLPRTRTWNSEQHNRASAAIDKGPSRRRRPVFDYRLDFGPGEDPEHALINGLYASGQGSVQGRVGRDASRTLRHLVTAMNTGNAAVLRVPREQYRAMKLLRDSFTVNNRNPGGSTYQWAVQQGQLWQHFEKSGKAIGVNGNEIRGLWSLFRPQAIARGTDAYRSQAGDANWGGWYSPGHGNINSVFDPLRSPGKIISGDDARSNVLHELTHGVDDFSARVMGYGKGQYSSVQTVAGKQILSAGPLQGFLPRAGALTAASLTDPRLGASYLAYRQKPQELLAHSVQETIYPEGMPAALRTGSSELTGLTRRDILPWLRTQADYLGYKQNLGGLAHLMASGGQVQRLAGGGQTRNLVIPNERIESFIFATTGQYANHRKRSLFREDRMQDAIARLPSKRQRPVFDHSLDFGSDVNPEQVLINDLYTEGQDAVKRRVGAGAASTLRSLSKVWANGGDAVLRVPRSQYRAMKLLRDSFQNDPRRAYGSDYQWAVRQGQAWKAFGQIGKDVGIGDSDLRGLWSLFKPQPIAKGSYHYNTLTANSGHAALEGWYDPAQVQLNAVFDPLGRPGRIEPMKNLHGLLLHELTHGIDDFSGRAQGFGRQVYLSRVAAGNWPSQSTGLLRPYLERVGKITGSTLAARNLPQDYLDYRQQPHELLAHSLEEALYPAGMGTARLVSSELTDLTRKTALPWLREQGSLLGQMQNQGKLAHLMARGGPVLHMEEGGLTPGLLALNTPKGLRSRSGASLLRLTPGQQGSARRYVNGRVALFGSDAPPPLSENQKQTLEGIAFERWLAKRLPGANPGAGLDFPELGDEGRATLSRLTGRSAEGISGIEAKRTASAANLRATARKALARWMGGEVQHFAKGGEVPALLMPGEYVLNREAVGRIGLANLHRMNATGDSSHVRRYHKGGFVQRFEGGGDVEEVPLANMGAQDFPDIHRGLAAEAEKLKIPLAKIATILVNFAAEAGPAFVKIGKLVEEAGAAAPPAPSAQKGPQLTPDQAGFMQRNADAAFLQAKKSVAKIRATGGIVSATPEDIASDSLMAAALKYDPAKAKGKTEQEKESRFLNRIIKNRSLRAAAAPVRPTLSLDTTSDEGASIRVAEGEVVADSVMSRETAAQKVAGYRNLKLDTLKGDNLRRAASGLGLKTRSQEGGYVPDDELRTSLGTAIGLAEKNLIAEGVDFGSVVPIDPLERPEKASRKGAFSPDSTLAGLREGKLDRDALGKLNVKNLKSVAKAGGLKDYSKLSKGALVDAIYDARETFTVPGSEPTPNLAPVSVLERSKEEVLPEGQRARTTIRDAVEAREKAERRSKRRRKSVAAEEVSTTASSEVVVAPAPTLATPGIPDELRASIEAAAGVGPTDAATATTETGGKGGRRRKKNLRKTDTPAPPPPVEVVEDKSAPLARIAGQIAALGARPEPASPAPTAPPTPAISGGYPVQLPPVSTTTAGGPANLSDYAYNLRNKLQPGQVAVGSPGKQFAISPGRPTATPPTDDSQRYGTYLSNPLTGVVDDQTLRQRGALPRATAGLPGSGGPSRKTQVGSAAILQQGVSGPPLSLALPLPLPSFGVSLPILDDTGAVRADAAGAATNTPFGQRAARTQEAIERSPRVQAFNAGVVKLGGAGRPGALVVNSGLRESRGLSTPITEAPRPQPQLALGYNPAVGGPQDVSLATPAATVPSGPVSPPPGFGTSPATQAIQGLLSSPSRPFRGGEILRAQEEARSNRRPTRIQTDADEQRSNRRDTTLARAETDELRGNRRQTMVQPSGNAQPAPTVSVTANPTRVNPRRSTSVRGAREVPYASVVSVTDEQAAVSGLPFATPLPGSPRTRLVGVPSVPLDGAPYISDEDAAAQGRQVLQPITVGRGTSLQPPANTTGFGPSNGMAQRARPLYFLGRDGELRNSVPSSLRSYRQGRVITADEANTYRELRNNRAFGPDGPVEFVQPRAALQRGDEAGRIRLMAERQRDRDRLRQSQEYVEGRRPAISVAPIEEYEQRVTQRLQSLRVNRAAQTPPTPATQPPVRDLNPDDDSIPLATGNIPPLPPTIASSGSPTSPSSASRSAALTAPRFPGGGGGGGGGNNPPNNPPNNSGSPPRFNRGGGGGPPPPPPPPPPPGGPPPVPPVPPTLPPGSGLPRNNSRLPVNVGAGRPLNPNVAGRVQNGRGYYVQELEDILRENGGDVAATRAQVERAMAEQLRRRDPRLTTRQASQLATRNTDRLFERQSRVEQRRADATRLNQAADAATTRADGLQTAAQAEEDANRQRVQAAIQRDRDQAQEVQRTRQRAAAQLATFQGRQNARLDPARREVADRQNDLAGADTTLRERQQVQRDAERALRETRRDAARQLQQARNAPNPALEQASAQAGTASTALQNARDEYRQQLLARRSMRERLTDIQNGSGAPAQRGEAQALQAGLQDSKARLTAQAQVVAAAQREAQEAQRNLQQQRQAARQSLQATVRAQQARVQQAQTAVETARQQAESSQQDRTVAQQRLQVARRRLQAEQQAADAAIQAERQRLQGMVQQAQADKTRTARAVQDARAVAGQPSASRALAQQERERAQQLRQQATNAQSEAEALRSRTQIARDRRTDAVLGDAGREQTIEQRGGKGGIFGALRGGFASGGMAAMRAFSQVGIVGGTLLAPYISQGLSSLGDTAENAAKKGRGDSFVGLQATSGGLTGAAVGASVAAGLGMTGPGILAAAAVAGLATLVSSYKQAAQEIREAKIGLSLTDLSDQLETISKGLVSFNSSTSIDALSNVRGSRQTFRDKLFADNTWMLTGLDTAGVEKSYRSELRRTFAPQLGGAAQAINAAAIEVGKGNFAFEGDGKALRGKLEADLQAVGGGLVKELLQLTADVRGIPLATVLSEFTEAAISAQREEAQRRGQIKAEQAAARTAVVFERLAVAAEVASTALQRSEERLKLSTDLFEGRLSAGRTTGISSTLASFGSRPSSDPIFSGALNAATAPLGELGSQLAEQARQINEVARVAPSVLGSVLSEKGTTEGTLGSRFRDRSREALGFQEGKVPLATEQALQAIIGKLEGQKLEDIAKEAGADAGKFIQGLLAPIVDAVRSSLDRLARAAEENATFYESQLTSIASLGRQQSDTSYRADQAGLAAQRFRAQRANEAAGRGSFDDLPMSVLTGPMRRRAEELSGLKGDDALDPGKVAGRLARAQEAVAAAQVAKDRAVRSPLLPGENETGRATRINSAIDNLVKTKAEADKLNQALRNLAESTEDVSAAQEKLGRIQQDRESRLSYGEKYLRGDPREQAQMRRGIQQAYRAVEAGNLDGMTTRQRNQVLDTLSSLGDTKLTGFKGELTARQYRENLIRNSKGQYFDIAPGTKNDENGLKDTIQKGLDRQAKALEALSGVQEGAQQRFLRELAASQKEFLAELGISLAQSQKADLDSKKAQAAGELIKLRDREKLAKPLIEAGIDNQAKVSVLRDRSGELQKLAVARASDVELRNKREEDFGRGSALDTLRVGTGMDSNSVLEGFGFMSGPQVDKLKQFLTERFGGNARQAEEVISKVRDRAIERDEDFRTLRGNMFTSKKGAPEWKRAAEVLDLLIGDVVSEITEKEIKKRQETDERKTMEKKVDEALKDTGLQKEKVLRIPALRDDRLLKETLGAFDGKDGKVPLEQLGKDIKAADEKVQEFEKAIKNITDTIKVKESQLRIIRDGREGVPPAVPVEKKAMGGIVGAGLSHTPGVPGSPRGIDRVALWAAPGEFVVRREQAAQNMGLLKAINAASGPVYMAEGGVVTANGLPVGGFSAARRGVNNLLTAIKAEARAVDKENVFDRVTALRFLQEYGVEKAQKTEWWPDLFDEYLLFVNRRNGLLPAKVARAAPKVKTPPTREEVLKKLGRADSLSASGLRGMRDRITGLNINRNDELYTPAQRAAAEKEMRRLQSAIDFSPYRTQRDSLTRQRAIANLGTLDQGQRKVFGELETLQQRNRMETFDRETARNGSGLSVLEQYQARLAREKRMKRQEFAVGGMVQGPGSGDTVPAMLTPGEFVLRKSVAQQIGYNLLEGINAGKVKGFALGGTVGATGQGVGAAGLSPEAVAALNAFASSTGVLTASLKELSNSLSGFVQNTSELARAMANFPSQMSVTATHQVNVSVTGAEALKALENGMGQMVVKLIDQKLGEAFRATFGPDTPFRSS